MATDQQSGAHAVEGPDQTLDRGQQPLGRDSKEKHGSRSG
jgi:hypothetical protein